MKLKRIFALAAITALAVPAMLGAAPKYVFYFIGDGMGLGHISCAEAYNRTVLGNDKNLFMLQFPVVSMATSHSASSPITDSAAGGTALATGHKTNNGMIGVTPDTTAVESIAAKLFKKGWGVGIVTSAAPDDATPGSFYAHQPKRSMYYEIGKDMASCGYEFVGGANLRGTKDKAGKPTDLLKYFAENNVSIVRGTDALKDVSTRRVLLLNTDTIEPNSIGYTIDSIPGAMTLTDMTRACLNHLLKTSPEHFFMMVESSNIDHAAHSNDGGAVIKEIISFQDAIKVAYDFYMKHPKETLIVISADHNTGGMSLSNTHLHYTARLKTIDSQRISKDEFSTWCNALLKQRKYTTWEEMKKELSDKLGLWSSVRPTKKQTEYIKDMFDKTFRQRNASKTHKTLYNTSNEFVEAVFNTFNDLAGVGFTSESHAGDFVPVISIGVDSRRFHGMHDNTDLPKMILDIATGK